MEYQVDIIILLKVLEHSTFLVYRLSSLLYVSTGLQRNKLQMLLSQKVTYLFCDDLDIDSKVLIGRVRQATKDVVKSEV